MTPLLQQFLAEARDLLEAISEQLIGLEQAPHDTTRMNELFRLVHTLKGNSGLFDFPVLTSVLHAAEDLMDAVREGQVEYSQTLADHLLAVADFVLALLDEIESTGNYAATWQAQAQQIKTALKTVRAGASSDGAPAAATPEPVAASPAPAAVDPMRARALGALAQVPEPERLAQYRALAGGGSLCWVLYQPEGECFYKGEDPLFVMVQLSAALWRAVEIHSAWPSLATLDAYHCNVLFEAIVPADVATLAEHFRYMPEQVTLIPLTPEELPWPLVGIEQEVPALAEFVRAAQARLAARDLTGLQQAARTLLELTAPEVRVASALRWLLTTLEVTPQADALHAALLASIDPTAPPPAPAVTPTATAVTPTAAAMPNALVTTPAAAAAETPELACALAWQEIWEASCAIAALTDTPPWWAGRLQAVGTSLTGLLTCMQQPEAVATLHQALAQSLADGHGEALRAWLATQSPPPVTATAAPVATAAPAGKPNGNGNGAGAVPPVGAAASDEKFGRRSDDNLPGPRTLKVEQSKVDRLMNLIGEMVVAKNALPYLAGRAENVFGVRELAREIKAQYAVINRVAEDMQDAIMQVRMMPVSFVLQRFPRLVRDLARKLGKDVQLIMDGEDTEADKNIIEALGDPLVHCVRNSLDHGIEMPDQRRAAGKSPTGRITIRAATVSDRVVIEIIDDGRGIDPQAIRRKAYERGLIDEMQLERINDHEATNLVFLPGFSTAEQITDVSGRGVGMDVVRTAVAKVNGAVELTSELGKGTRLKLSLPLSMAVTNVMIVRAHERRFGIPMDAVVETVRVPRRAMRIVKHRYTTVLRGRLVPLVALNSLLALPEPPHPNDDDAYATLVVRIGNDQLGILVDDFRETVDIILKPLTGILTSLRGYAGSALLGDGSVLLVLDLQDLVSCSN